MGRSDDAGSATPEAGDARLLADIVEAVLARSARGTWTVEPGAFWCMLTPPQGLQRDQGWKLHVSATELSAPIVLSRVAAVLIGDACAFKFTRGLAELASLLTNQCDRGSGGKFITAYPEDTAQFRRLATKLDLATDGLPGPVILSDRPLRPNSLVHYRFGVFNARPVLGNDGTYESLLTGPDGQLTKDERRAWFSPPPWAVPPLPDDASAAVPDRSAGPPTPVLIGDRFVVGRAVRHSYRGGVYQATDRVSGVDVILKQARPHTMSGLTGTDARDALRHEAEILELLGPLGLTPRKVALISHQDHLFLAEELIPGVQLRRWAADRAVERSDGRGAPLAEVVAMARRLAAIVTAVHEQDLVLRDFTPNNLMVTPDGDIRLVDLESAVRTGARVPRVYTPAYAAPEQVSAPPFGPAPDQRADLYSLGASLLYLASGVDPLLPADVPDRRPGQARLAEFVTVLGTHMPAVRAIAPLVLGLMRDDPDERWTLARTGGFLDAVVRSASAGPPVAAVRLPGSDADRLLSDGLRYLLRTMKPQGAWLWPASDFGATTDPANVQHGAAGVLGVLTRSVAQFGADDLREGVATVAGWLGARLFGVPRILPGLYFGRSGLAWAMYDAGRLLGDDAMAARAIGLAKRIPVRWPNPDVCHGAAGAGLAQLYLWQATGDPEFERRAGEAADSVLQAARSHDGRVVWPIPATFDSELAGLTHYGFAHGVAGVGAFLLYCGLATGRDALLDAARQAGDTLASVAQIDGAAAWWQSGEAGDANGSRMPHWCSGSSGAGTFLIRLWLVTGEQRFRDLAEAAAEAVHRAAWRSSTAACHGLAGDGEFLLDLADFTGEQRHRDVAAELAAVMHTRHAVRNGLAVLPDEFGSDVRAGYSTGLSGALGFLLRLRHGGRRWWMPDEILTNAGYGAAATLAGAAQP